jgi:hypothetical protein
VPADWEDPNSPDWEPPVRSTALGAAWERPASRLRCSNYRQHPTSKLLGAKSGAGLAGRTVARFVAERPYCSPCYYAFGPEARKRMEKDREAELAFHRLKPDPNLTYTIAYSIADCRKQLATALKYGCHHRDLHHSHWRGRKNWNCVCIQMYKVDGIALIGN